MYFPLILAFEEYKVLLTSRSLPITMKQKLAAVKVDYFNSLYSMMRGNLDLTLYLLNFLISNFEPFLNQIKNPTFCIYYRFYENELVFEEGDEFINEFATTEERNKPGKKEFVGKEISYWTAEYISKEKLCQQLDMKLEFETLYSYESNVMGWNIFPASHLKKAFDFFDSLKKEIKKETTRNIHETDYAYEVEGQIFPKDFNRGFQGSSLKLSKQIF